MLAYHIGLITIGVAIIAWIALLILASYISHRGTNMSSKKICDICEQVIKYDFDHHYITLMIHGNASAKSDFYPWTENFDFCSSTCLVSFMRNRGFLPKET